LSVPRRLRITAFFTIPEKRTFKELYRILVLGVIFGRVATLKG
jgi:hypothetical protein